MIDVFSVGIHLGMTTNSGHILGMLSRDLGRTQGEAEKLAKEFARIKVAIAAAGATGSTQALPALEKSLAQVSQEAAVLEKKAFQMKAAIGGALAIGAGVEIGKGVWDAVNAAKELNSELTKTAQYGGEFAATVKQAEAHAFDVAKRVPTMTPELGVRWERELGNQLQNPKAGMDALEMAARTAAAVSHFTGEDQEKIVKNLIKVAELRAQIFTLGPDGKEHVDLAKLGPELDAAGKGLQIGGGYISSYDLLQMAKQAGVPAKNMTKEAFYAEMVEMAVSQGASRAGTATTSLFSQLVGGSMPLHTAEEMQRMGLLKEGEWHKDHGKVVIGQEATQRFSEALKDPIAYITGPLNDLMTAQGMSLGDKIMEVLKLFGRQTAQRLVAEGLSSEPSFARSRVMFNEIPSIDSQYNTLMGTDLEMNEKALGNAWKGFTEALGQAGIPLAIKVLTKMTDALTSMSQWANANPEISAKLLALAGGVGALVAVLGSAAIVAAAISALGVLAAPAGLLALAVGITALGKAFSGVPDWIVRMVQGAAIGGAAGSAIPVVGTIAGAGIGAAAGLGSSLIYSSPIGQNAAKREADYNKLKGTMPWFDPANRPKNSQDVNAYLNGLASPPAGSGSVTPPTPEQIRATLALMPAPPLPPGTSPDAALDATMNSIKPAPAPPAAGTTINLKSTLEVDGKAMAQVVNSANVRAGSGASSGGTPSNGRVTPDMPGGGPQ